MDFKDYYHKKLDEEAMAQQQSLAGQSLESQATNGSVESLVSKYIGSGEIKDGLKQLGLDIGEAITNYALNTYVTDDMFDSVDAKSKYVNIITQKIQQQATSTLAELLRHMAIDIQNSKNTLTI